MTTQSKIPYEWLKSVDPELLALDSHPLFGYYPKFPWEQFSQDLANAFKIESLEIKPGELRWREGDELYQDLGDQLHIQKVTLSTISGEVAFVIDKEDLRFIMFALLQQSQPKELQIYDEEIEKGFYRYLALEAVRCFTDSDFDKTLSPHLLAENELPEGPSLGYDIQVTLLDRTVLLRLLISSGFQRSFKEHYAERTLLAPVSQELLKKTETILHLQVGRVALSQEEFKSIKEGDLILLDQCYVDPKSKSGQVVLTLGGVPKFRATLENNAMTLMEAPLFHEETGSLVKQEEVKDG